MGQIAISRLNEDDFCHLYFSIGILNLNILKSHVTKSSNLRRMKKGHCEKQKTSGEVFNGERRLESQSTSKVAKLKR